MHDDELDDRRSSGTTRGQTVPLSVVLLVGILTLSLATIGVFGGGFAQNTREGVALEAAEKRLVDVSGAISAVGPGGTDTSSMDVQVGSLSNRGRMTVAETSGHLTVRVGGEVVHSGPLGAIRYESGSGSVAYQAGAVVRASSENSSEVVSAPSLAVRDRGTPTLTFPLFVVRGGGSISDGVTVSTIDSRVAYSQLRVPSDEAVMITLQSRYYRAWERIFEARFGSDATVGVDPASETVTATLLETDDAYFHCTVYTVSVGDA